MLVVLARSDSFAALWPELAQELSLEFRIAVDADQLGPLNEATALILAVAGVEQDAPNFIRELISAGAPAPLVVGARTEHRLAATVVRAGAADYLALPADLELLRTELAVRVQRQRARVAGRQLTESERDAFDFSRILGESAALRAALGRAARIIPRERATVLITGETGTGKELLAQAIHYNGPRAAAPFVDVNCMAIPSTLLEAELFGYERGAFTDARTAKPGLFEAAQGGTLFLDEIGHLGLPLQGKLLRALEEKQTRRLGSLRAREVDVRIIAATHVDLAAAVRRGEFREDLFYRLNVIPIHLPALRERGDDVLLLADHFLTSLARQHNVVSSALTSGLRREMLRYAWPGNVRELRNSIERALLLGDGALDPADLFLHGRAAAAVSPAGSQALPFPASLAEIERAAAHAMTDRLEGNKSAAADALGISRSRLYRLLADGASVPE